MKLTAYVIEDNKVRLRRAPLERSWMDATPERFAYRCLPLKIANTYGWEVLCPSAFSARWDGEAGAGSVVVESPAEKPPARSHFGVGLLTFIVPCIFRTEPGYDLMVQGPANCPKDAIAPLSGIVETDWAPFPFTMNWIFTQPEIDVEFEEGEPFCTIFPIRRGEIETFEPELRHISSDPDLEARYNGWAAHRNRFNLDLEVADSEAQAEKWQKHYERGADWDFTAAAPRDHRTELKLREFKDLTDG